MFTDPHLTVTIMEQITGEHRKAVRLSVYPGSVKPRLEMEARFAVADATIDPVLKKFWAFTNPRSVQWDNRRKGVK